MEKITVDQFAEKVKKKWPDYANIDNRILAQKVVAKYPVYAESVDFGEDGPGLGRVVGGLAAEIAVAEGAKIAGASAGAAIGAGLGSPTGPGALVTGGVGGSVGYVAGAITGGISGSLLAQRIEGREEVSYGRVVADTLLNMLPGGLGKTKKTLDAAKATRKLLPRIKDTSKAVAKYTGKRGTQGAVIGTGAMSVEKAIEEGEWLTGEEFLQVAGTSAALNIGLGVAGDALVKSYKKFAGKAPEVLDKAYRQGDHDAISVVESLIGEAPAKRGERYLKMLQAKIVPETHLGPRVTGATHDMIAKQTAAIDLAATVSKKVKNITKGLSQEKKDQLDDYIFGRSKQLIPEAKGQKEVLDTARDKIKEHQKNILGLYLNGRIDMHENVAAKIMKSIDTGDYSTREYRFFEEPNFRPDAEVESKLRKALTREMKGDDATKEAKVNDLIQGLYDSRVRAIDGLNMIASNKRIFKKRKDLIPELKEFLGEYTESDQKIFGTLNRLGRVAAQEAGHENIVNNLLKYGMAEAREAGQDVITNNMRPLYIGSKAQQVGGKGVYVDDITQRAIKEMFAGGLTTDASSTLLGWISRAAATGAGMAKFMRVPANFASYTVQPIGNLMLASMQGMNPFRGWRQGFSMGVTDLNTRRIRDGKIKLRDINRLKELDLIDKGATISDIRASFSAGFGKNIVRKPMDKIGKLYNSVDTAQRISIYENWKGKLRQLLPASEYNKLSTAKVEEIAAELTNTTYMNYGRINKNLRALSKYGILNEFAAFNLEMLRTTFNQAKLIKDMRTGKFANDMQQAYGVKLNQKALQSESAKRLAAMSAVIGIGSVGVTALNRADGIDEETEEAIRESLVAPWEEDQALNIRMDGSKLTAANMSYQVPTGELSSIVESALRGEDFLDAIGKGIESTWSKFGGDLSIHLKNLVAAISNTDLQSGKKISNEQGLRKMMGQVKYYFGENFTPGTVRDIQKMDERSDMDNLLRFTLGYRSRSFEVKDAIGYKFRDVRKAFDGIRSKYASATHGDESLDEAYLKSNDSYKRTTQELIKHVNNLKTIRDRREDLVLPDSLIIQYLKDAGIRKAQIQDAMSGRIRDMPIAVGVSGKRDVRLKRYIELAGKLSEPMLRKMIEDEFAKKKITRYEALSIIGAVKLKKATK